MAKTGKIKKEYTKSRRHKETIKGVDRFSLVFLCFKIEIITIRFSLKKIK